MYITFPAPQKTEVWVSDIDGGNKLKIATGENLSTGTWAPDNFHLCFFEQGADAGFRVYIAGADGSGLRQVPPMGGRPDNSVWSSDQKSVYVNIANKAGTPEIWKWNVDNSNPEKFVDNCGIVTDADPRGKYLIGTAGTGIFEVSISERKCIPLLPGPATSIANFARDGESFLYAVVSRAQVSIYRQPWRNGTVIGRPEVEVALKVPFAFFLIHAGNAYDFSRDLSTVVYARPGGHGDLYLLGQK